MSPGRFFPESTAAVSRAGVWLVVLACCFAGEFASAQELRVYTKVYVPRPGTNDIRGMQPVTRGTTLFHAGRAFDRMEGSSEIVVFEPTHQRFMLIDPEREAQTEIRFDQIENLVHGATVRARQYILEKEHLRDDRYKELLKLMKCQLEPPFREQYDPGANTLTLECDAFRYVTSTAPSADAAIVKQYLRYADWTARLNFVLHPKASPPEPRIRLDAALVRLQVLPVKVRLEILAQPKSTRIAEHVFDTKLSTEDRRQLTAWDELLRSGVLKTVPYDEFQVASFDRKPSGK